MSWLRLAVLLTVAVVPSMLAAQETRTVISAAPERVALTVYREGYGNGEIDRANPQGFAMVTETRKVRLPRGRAELRFEGVAGGIIPVSAVIEGLPGGTIEKNRDARLLSPASLIDGTLGREVTITRIEKAAGRKVSEEATIIAGPRAGVVLRTPSGIETLHCSGLPERLAFDSIPSGLSSKPVLSVTTDSPAARTVTVRLSYLASGFDWRASYVATQAADGRTLNLFAWLTLANGNGETFPQAEVNAVAGRLNRVETPQLLAAISKLTLACYPLGTTTSDLKSREAPEQEIMVTASRRFGGVPVPLSMAMPAAPPAPPPPPPPEDLGDLKLYRVPERVTVAPHAQKQVALLSRDKVQFERRYRREVSPWQTLDAAPTAVVLVLHNESAAGLGLALPQGTTALYAEGPRGRQLLGLGTLTDRAEGETFRLSAGKSTQVMVSQKSAGNRGRVLSVTNANAFPVSVDIPIGSAGQKIVADNETLLKVDGVATWSQTLAPGENAELRYTY
ncbi:hypothetical protein EDF56_107108 [Novosphingobium sp. PhB165]|uniref:DUF4139 domain-containing protein n=1 Tax=Novosphingobium sp. PhB165 TaxID=2485105 RepID=UPI001052770A|nr:hypothetical protein [Novosphingobium sp. PhB165]TCM16529.1 hypothetical protein EDF56_107108 [Novosphingobium sp. PhB165]